MRRGALTAFVVVCGAIAVGCKQSRPAPQAAAVDAGEVAPPPLAPAPVAPARCALVDGAAARLAEGAERVEIGDAVARANGVALGVIRSGSGGATAGVALVTATPLGARFLAAASVSPDADPPKPLVRGEEVSALTIEHSRRDGGAPRATSLVLATLAEGKPPAPAATIAVRGDEPLADAVASPSGVLVAWEEDAADRGVVLVAMAGEKPRAVSPETTDADAPRVALRPGGFWVVWLAHKADSTRSADDEHRLEAPAEKRTSQWIEIVALDDHAAPLAPARPLTGPSGHIGGFDLATRPSGELDVLARDDEQPTEGAGGRILRITLHGERGETADPAAVVVADGVGRGAIDLVTARNGADAWLAFADVADHTRLVALGDARAPLGAPSGEAALDSARLLGVTAPDTLLAAFPSEDAQLRLVRCKR